MRYLIFGLVMFGVPVTFSTWSPLSGLFAASGEEPAPDPALFEARDVELFETKKAGLPSGSDLNQRLINAAKSFVGFPYVRGVLDRPAHEQLVLNLRQLDCWTYVEYALALALTPEDGSFEQFAGLVQKMRYRDGVISGYGSRLHYFSEWLIQGEQLGYFKNITADLGGVPYTQPVGYISARPEKYPRVKDPGVRQAVRRGEQRVNNAKRFFIPKNKVAAVESRLREGDMIVLTSVKKDLDVAHQGFAVNKNGRIHLMHASSLGGKVVVSSQPLPQYMAGQKGQSGIIVVRF